MGKIKKIFVAAVVFVCVFCFMETSLPVYASTPMREKDIWIYYAKIMEAALVEAKKQNKLAEERGGGGMPLEVIMADIDHDGAEEMIIGIFEKDEYYQSCRQYYFYDIKHKSKGPYRDDLYYIYNDNLPNYFSDKGYICHKAGGEGPEETDAEFFTVYDFDGTVEKKTVCFGSGLEWDEGELFPYAIVNEDDDLEAITKSDFDALCNKYGVRSEEKYLGVYYEKDTERTIARIRAKAK